MIITLLFDQQEMVTNLRGKKVLRRRYLSSLVGAIKAQRQERKKRIKKAADNKCRCFILILKDSPV